jgi:hypothetical protein
MYSVATSVGTANINPLTNLAVAAAAGVNDPGSVYSNPASYPITSANLTTAISNIQTMLQPLLNTYNANINPVTGRYTADHTGLDGVFDVVTVSINTSSGVVTVMDKTTDTKIGSATTTSLANPADPITTQEVPSTQAITDLQDISTFLSDFTTTLNKGASLTAADLAPSFATSWASSGVNNGLTKAQSIGTLVAFFKASPKTITRITDLTLEAKNGPSSYIITFTIYFSDGSFLLNPDGSREIYVIKENGAWKFTNNGFLSDNLSMIGATTEKRENADGTTTIASGLWFEMEDYNGLGIQSAVITGPGLPQNGVILNKELNGTRLNISTQNGYNLYVLSDTVILNQLPDNSVYTIKVYSTADHTGNPIETRHKTIPKGPFTYTQVTSLNGNYFPDLLTMNGSTQLSNALSSVIPGPLAFTFTSPTSYLISWINTDLSVWDSSGTSASTSKILTIAQTSGSLTTPAMTSPVGAQFLLFVVDNFDRAISYKWFFQ